MKGHRFTVSEIGRSDSYFPGFVVTSVYEFQGFPLQRQKSRRTKGPDTVERTRGSADISMEKLHTSPFAPFVIEL
ncbi:hypothetical protein BDM02DRAFT_3111169 [Thelephora ganbajun]|uniref:Uncharacterized protein n=1 Tax=Thelephora ganbajun TaxID=370292 RepID=A0ACB6ZNX8_THEGA|nr:hypothetical protein BDM02DRAFT_3111169 [Thelephora ganbajun]